MGNMYWFGCQTDKEYITFESSKYTEVRNSFNGLMIIHFLQMNCVHRSAEFLWLADESGDWDEVIEGGWEDVTCDVLVSMFEDGFKPSKWKFGWIYSKFKGSGRLKELSEWMVKWDEKR